MNFITEALNKFIDMLTTVWDVLTHVFNSFYLLLRNLSKYITTLQQLINYIPATYQAILIATVAISIVFLVTNRGE